MSKRLEAILHIANTYVGDVRAEYMARVLADALAYAWAEGVEHGLDNATRRLGSRDLDEIYAANPYRMAPSGGAK